MSGSGCPSYEDIEKLVFSSSDGDPEPIHFLRHIKQCARCRYIWEQLAGYRSETEKPGTMADSTERMISAMSRKGAIVLLPFRKRRENIEETSITTMMAADTGDFEDNDVTEVATLASEVEGVLLRILKNEGKRRIQLFLSSENRRLRAVRLYLQGLEEPVEIGEDGTAIIPLEVLASLKPSLAVILPA